MFEPDDLLSRLIRATARDSGAHRTGKIRALARVSAVGSVASSRAARQPTRVAAVDPPDDAMVPLSEDTTAAVVRFRAADAELIIRAMVAAAAADCDIDQSEVRRIASHLRDSGSTAAELEFVEQETQHPSAPEDLARGITSREIAVELYAAALLVTAATTPGTRAFLARLSQALGLEAKFVAELHAAWGDPPPAAG